MEGQFKSLSISQPTNIQLDDLFDILDVWEELLRLGRLWTFFDTDYVETVANNIQMGMDNEVAWILINLEKEIFAKKYSRYLQVNYFVGWFSFNLFFGVTYAFFLNKILYSFSHWSCPCTC